MNTNSNTYTLVYAAILVVVVATALAFVSEALKPIQQSNIENEKRLNILSAAHLDVDADLFDKYITKSYLINTQGEKIEGNAFETGVNEGKLPVFECTLDNGTQLYIVPCYGQGLWGPIWGYISLRDDCNTIYGAVFDHKGETPGLGAEISTKQYAQQFDGKKLFDNNKFVSISVVKGGAKPSDLHAVDAISGGTITSKALESTIYESLQAYVPFFRTQSTQ